VNGQAGNVNARSRYASHRGCLLPTVLSELTGPVTGVVELPTRLDWSEQGVYDLSDSSQVGLMYERVIREATRLEDLRTYYVHSFFAQHLPPG
jgi:hypothetical protein